VPGPQERQEPVDSKLGHPERLSEHLSVLLVLSAWPSKSRSQPPKARAASLLVKDVDRTAAPSFDPPPVTNALPMELA
jgi:hypothetical protein